MLEDVNAAKAVASETFTLLKAITIRNLHTMARSAPVPLIVDTDPGIDDILAILLALDRPDLVNVEAITLTFGNTTLDYCRDNIVRLFGILQQHIAEDPTEINRSRLAKVIGRNSPAILLSQGAQGPLGGQRFTASYFHGRDGVSGISELPNNPWPVPRQVPSPLQETSTAAHDVILEVLRKHPPGTVRIAAVGPLTNIAMAWEKDPETFLRVGGISVMGAALDVPGNVSLKVLWGERSFTDLDFITGRLHHVPNLTRMLTHSQPVYYYMTPPNTTC
jgi:inosine-uridine nucleoside N-ribohydrolase